MGVELYGCKRCRSVRYQVSVTALARVSCQRQRSTCVPMACARLPVAWQSNSFGQDLLPANVHWQIFVHRLSACASSDPAEMLMSLGHSSHSTVEVQIPLGSDNGVGYIRPWPRLATGAHAAC